MPDLVDPVAAPSASISRRGFLGLSAGAAAAAANIAATLAEGKGLGSFHPPLVAEDDPAIDVERPMLARPDGAIDAYAVFPKGAPRSAPGVVVVQHVWGVDAQIRDVVRRFAKAGYASIAPDLYARQHAPSGDLATDYTLFTPFAQALVDSQVDGDLIAAASWLRARAGVGPDSRPPKIGITGFCMGGSITLRASVDDPQFDAAAVWYGKVRQANGAAGSATDISLAYYDNVRMPLCGSFGSRDASIPADDVRALDARLTVPHDLKLYDEAGHGFFDDTRKAYVASAAADAWRRTIGWFGKYLAT